MAKFGQKSKKTENRPESDDEGELRTHTIKKQSKDEVSILETKFAIFSQALIEFRNKAFDKLIEQVDLATVAKMGKEDLHKEIERFLGEYCDESHARITLRERQQVTEDIINDMVGLGPLEVLLKDPLINDILVNKYDSIFVEKQGVLYLTDVKFRNERHVMQVAQRIANIIGRRIDESSPMVDTRLKDGSRVNIVIPPIAIDAVSISIRKFSKKSFTLEQMKEKGSLSSNMVELLRIAAKCRLNIIVSGGTGAGKTTLLNALSQLIDPNERIVTIEDSAELNLGQPHVVRLESRPPNIEGEGEIAIHDLLRNSLRMRPDRIVIGECRGPEAFDMLQAMNTGHDGSLSTVHANSAREAINRLENMVLMTGHKLPTEAIRNYIADAADLVVHVSRMRDGNRKITQIMEINGVKNGEVDSQDIFVFAYDHEDDDGVIHGDYKCLTKSPLILERAKIFNLDKELMNCLK